jgi:hypothetical protein
MLRLALFLLLASAPLMPAPEGPGWWSEVIDPSVTPQNYAAINQGQVKALAAAAIDEFNAVLPGGAGTALNNTLAAWRADTTSNNYAAANIGQIKTVAKPLHQRLLELGYISALPDWTDPAAPNQENHALANLGQLKNLFNFDPAADTDNDGIPDMREIVLGLDHENFDSDFDQMPDGWELANGTNPLVNDADLDLDGDTLTNLTEYQLGTKANSIDSDSDTMDDGWEVENGLNPLVNDANGDPDLDGLTNGNEYTAQTNPKKADTDGDLVNDCWEVSNNFNPLDPADALLDTDGDRVPDMFEVAKGSDKSDPASLPAPDLSVNPASPVSSTNFATITAALATLTDPAAWTIISIAPGDHTGTPIFNDAQGKLLFLGTPGNPPPRILPPGDDTINIPVGSLVHANSLIISGANRTGTAPLLTVADGAHLSLVNTLLTAAPALAIHLEGRASLLHTTVADNTGNEQATSLQLGSAAKLDFRNSILWNPPTAPATTPEIQSSPTATIAASHSLMRGGLASGTNILDVDPLVLVEQHSRLAIGSPAIGHGSLVSDRNVPADAFQIIRPTAPSAGYNEYDPDTDGDGMADAWEIANGLNPLINDANGDPDLDGLNNLAEFNARTNPKKADTDGDLVNDGWEVQNQFDPLDPTDALLDTDGDRVPDMFEVAKGTDKNNPASAPSADIRIDAAARATPHNFASISEALAILEDSEEWTIISLAGADYPEAPTFESTQGKLLLLGDQSSIPARFAPDTDGTISFLPGASVQVDSLVFSGHNRESTTTTDLLHVSHGSRISLVNTYLTQAPGVALNLQGTAHLLHTTLFANKCDTNTTALKLGAAAELDLRNSIFWNPPVAPDTTGEFIHTPGSALSADSCIIRGGFTNGTNIIDLDPLVLVTQNGRLAFGSPGLSSALPKDNQPSPADIFRYPRPPNCDLGHTQYDPARTDTDSDGLPDAIENQIINADPDDNISNFADVVPGGDYDGDGITNLAEFLAETNAVDPASQTRTDSDGDGIPDFKEILEGSDPTDWASIPTGTGTPGEWNFEFSRVFIPDQTSNSGEPDPEGESDDTDGDGIDNHCDFDPEEAFFNWETAGHSHYAPLILKTFPAGTSVDVLSVNKHGDILLEITEDGQNEYAVFSGGGLSQLVTDPGVTGFYSAVPHTILDDGRIVGQTSSDQYVVGFVEEKAIVPPYENVGGGYVVPAIWTNAQAVPQIVHPDSTELESLLRLAAAPFLALPPETRSHLDLNVSFFGKHAPNGITAAVVSVHALWGYSTQTWIEWEGSGWYDWQEAQDRRSLATYGVYPDISALPIWRTTEIQEDAWGFSGSFAEVLPTGHAIYQNSNNQFILHGPDGTVLAQNINQITTTPQPQEIIAGQDGLIVAGFQGNTVRLTAPPDDAPFVRILETGQAVPVGPFLTDTDLAPSGSALPIECGTFITTAWTKIEGIEPGQPYPSTAPVHLVALIGTQMLSPGANTNSVADTLATGGAAGTGNGNIIAKISQITHTPAEMTITIEGQFVDPLGFYLDRQPPVITIKESGTILGTISQFDPRPAAGRHLFKPVDTKVSDFSAQVVLPAKAGLTTISLSTNDRRTDDPIGCLLEFYVNVETTGAMPPASQARLRCNLNGAGDPSALDLAWENKILQFLPAPEALQTDGMRVFKAVDGSMIHYLTLETMQPAANEADQLSVQFSFQRKGGYQRETGLWQETAANSLIFTPTGTPQATSHRLKVVMAKTGASTNYSPPAISLPRIFAPAAWIEPGGPLRLRLDDQNIPLKEMTFSPPIVYGVANPESEYPDYRLWVLKDGQTVPLGADGMPVIFHLTPGDGSYWLDFYNSSNEFVGQRKVWRYEPWAAQDDDEAEVWEMIDEGEADHILDSESLRNAVTVIYGKLGRAMIDHVLPEAPGGVANGPLRIHFQNNFNVNGHENSMQDVGLLFKSGQTPHIHFMDTADPMGAAQFFFDQAYPYLVQDRQTFEDIVNELIDDGDPVTAKALLARRFATEFLRLIELGFTYTKAVATTLVSVAIPVADLALTFDAYLDGKAAFWELAASAIPFVPMHKLGLAVGLAPGVSSWDNPAALLHHHITQAVESIRLFAAATMGAVGIHPPRLILTFHNAKEIVEWSETAVPALQTLREVGARSALKERSRIFGELDVLLDGKTLDMEESILGSFRNIVEKPPAGVGREKNFLVMESMEVAHDLTNKTYESYKAKAREVLKSNLRADATKIKGAKDEGHHWLPVEFEGEFLKHGLDPNLAKYGDWMSKDLHTGVNGIHILGRPLDNIGPKVRTMEANGRLPSGLWDEIDGPLSADGRTHLPYNEAWSMFFAFFEEPVKPTRHQILSFLEAIQEKYK